MLIKNNNNLDEREIQKFRICKCQGSAAAQFLKDCMKTKTEPSFASHLKHVAFKKKINIYILKSIMSCISLKSRKQYQL